VSSIAPGSAYAALAASRTKSPDPQQPGRAGAAGCALTWSATNETRAVQIRAGGREVHNSGRVITQLCEDHRDFFGEAKGDL